jgi:uncharacterized protein (TIRG00374 family)
MQLSNGRTGRVGKGLQSLANLSRSSMQLMRPRLLVMGILIGLLAWGAEGAGLYLICMGLHIDVNAPLAIGIYAVAVLAGSAAFFLPGGIGGMELVMTTLLVQASGTAVGSAVIATLLCRLATLWFAVLIGVGAAWAIEFRPESAQARTIP